MDEPLFYKLPKEELSRRLSFDLAFRLVLAEDDEDVEEPEPPVDVDDDELDEFDKDVAWLASASLGLSLPDAAAAAVANR